MQWWCSAQGEPWTWAWQAYPGVWVFIGALGFAYYRLLRATPDTGTGQWPRGVHIGCFVAALLALWVTLDWPIGAIGAGYLASVHMFQFLMLGMIVPPLMLYGMPEEVYARPSPRVLAVIRPLTRPAVAFVVFNVLVIATHLPPVVDGLMSSQLGSFVIDVAWLGAGLVFWWPVAAAMPGGSQLQELAKVGYLGFQLIAMKPVFIYLTFSTYPQYATYELAPRISGIGARADQQMAGLLMEVGGMIILLIAVGAVFLKWSAREERDVRRAPRPEPVQPAPARVQQ
jgi:cytochrome c oxidase assembly factor CtaG